MPLIIMQGVFRPLIPTGFTLLFGFPMDTAILHDTIIPTFDALHTHDDTVEISWKVVYVSMWNELYHMGRRVSL
jgi:hypothetical protein